LVGAARIAPGLGNQFASQGAWDEQLADRPLQPGRPVNLHMPADTDLDFGAHGTFDDTAHGVLEPSFLVTLPKAGREFASAFTATWSERIPAIHVVARRRREARTDPVPFRRFAGSGASGKRIADSPAVVR
jgi:hypothetical protein